MKRNVTKCGTSKRNAILVGFLIAALLAVPAFAQAADAQQRSAYTTNSVSALTLDSAADKQAVSATRAGWVKSGGAWRWYKGGKMQTDCWVVTGYMPGAKKKTGLQRFRINDEGKIQTGFFEVDKAHYYGIPSKGYVVRGVYKYNSNHVLIADNDGKMNKKQGWVVTKKYFKKGLQRYWFEPVKSNKFVGARTGYFTVDNKGYFGRPEGYVVRGTYTDSKRNFWIANNDGVLTKVGNILSMVNKAPKSSSLKYFGNTKGWKMSASASSKLHKAVKRFARSGQKVGIVLVDLSTGAGMSWNDNKKMYAASCMKAAYVTYVCEMILDKGKASRSSVNYKMTQTAVWSNNNTYLQLRNRFGSSGFNRWLASSGINLSDKSAYPFISPRDLARVWGKIGNYLMSNAKNAGCCRSILSHGYYSNIHNELGGANTTYSKPGWYNGWGRYMSYNDAGIVIGSDGRPYLLVVMTGSNYVYDTSKMRQLVRALDTVHNEMPR